eukprot:scaffold22976_cov35-Attheya_sp.AAC.2
MRISTRIQPSDSKKATSVITADGHGWVDAIVVPVPIPISYAQFWEHWSKWHPSVIVVHPSVVVVVVVVVVFIIVVRGWWWHRKRRAVAVDCP